MSIIFVLAACIAILFYTQIESEIGGEAMSEITTPSILTQMARAIERHESGGNLEARNYRNNNPGNLVYRGQAGTIGKDGNFAIFATYTDGWNALIAQLARYFNNTSSAIPNSANMSLYEFFNSYSPDGTGNSYARDVANQLGVDPNITLSELYNGQA
jgi:hypothetical protein